MPRRCVTKKRQFSILKGVLSCEKLEAPFFYARGARMEHFNEVDYITRTEIALKLIFATVLGFCLALGAACVFGVGI